ncbi:ParA family protein [Aureimonas sp. AU12]|uniref:ParA family protein n=1 Tax=Aureimonas sp. AU12 TaxID=1638161 RepID=UPI00078250C7|nr:ParA family protein [Aureimonas sp. AU12]
MPVISIGSLKSGGTTTLALTIASALAYAGCPVLLVDAARAPDLTRWSRREGCPAEIEVARLQTSDQLEDVVREGARRRRLVIIDAGFKRDRLRRAAALASLVVIPVRFSPLSVAAAVDTDRLLDAEASRRVFVASAVTPIPSRIARTVERELTARRTYRLPAGLGLRAAFEAPFLLGGTVHTLSPDAVPGLDKARRDAEHLLLELEMFGLRRPVRNAEPPLADALVAVSRHLSVPAGDMLQTA